MSRGIRLSLVVAAFLVAAGAVADPAAEPPRMSGEARQVEHDRDAFGPDPDYGDAPYEVEAQLDIYGGKRASVAPRPLLELGRRIYEDGPLRRAGAEPSDSLNPFIGQFAVYGDIRLAGAYTDFGPAGDLGQVALRANLEIDWKLTATERVHAFIRPFERDDGATTTRCHLSGTLSDDECETAVDGNLDALFFEGDLGAIVSALGGEYTSWDLPFAFGRMPLLMQNGVWVEDVFDGAAFSLAARNSRALDISNYDLTFFAGFDRVTTGALPGSDDARIVGVTAFIDANSGYWEVGYGYTDTGRVDDDLSYSNVTAAFTRRYFDRFSNSIRVLYNFGQDAPTAARTADGLLVLLETSLITRRPLTLVPYLNLFYGVRSPQSLARAGDAGGVLKTTGLAFESDGMTGFPTLDASARDTWGGALGLQYLFDLDRQIVAELATVRPHGDRALVSGTQYGFALRFQQTLSKAWIFRADALVTETRGAASDPRGVRVELRRKF